MRKILLSLSGAGFVLLLAPPHANLAFGQYQDTTSQSARGYSSDRTQANISDQGSGYGPYGPYGPYYTRSVIPNQNRTPSSSEPALTDGRPNLGGPLSGDPYMLDWYRQQAARRMRSARGVSWSEDEGRLVAREVTADSLLGRAGLRANDEIVSVDGHHVRSRFDWQQAVDAVPAGHEVPIVVRRDGDLVSLRWTPNAVGNEEIPTGRRTPGNDESQPFDFITAARLKPGPRGQSWLGVQLDRRYPDQAVVLSAEPGSAAAEAGLLPGDVIRSVSGQTIASSAELIRTLSKTRPGSSIELYVRRSPAGSADPLPDPK